MQNQINEVGRFKTEGQAIARTLTRSAESLIKKSQKNIELNKFFSAIIFGIIVLQIIKIVGKIILMKICWTPLTYDNLSIRV